MSDQEIYEQAKTDVVGATVRFMQAGERLGKTQAELSGEFMASFMQAAQQAQEAAA